MVGGGRNRLLLLAALCAFAGCGAPEPAAPEPGPDPDPTAPEPDPDPDPVPEPPLALRLTPVAEGLDRPLQLTAPEGDARLFVVEQTGRIRIVRDGTLLSEPFLDLSGAVTAGGERGLLGLAFHPEHASNGWFFVNYTDTGGDTRIVRYGLSSDPDVADPASAALVLAIPQPFSNHNGGHLLFGPDDMLYVSVGDGGSAGDPDGNGQNPATLLGSILRLDVDGDPPYAIPPDNPFAGDDSRRGEIWLWGLRNPWRMAFDRSSGRLYVADVGQARREEVTVVGPDAGGANLGWDVTEGTLCFEDPGCATAGLTLPQLEYDHGDGCSITGGHVYRGPIAGIRGHYFYSDFCEGWLRSFRFVDGAAAERTEWDVPRVGNVTSFGEDAEGELYLLTTDAVYRLDAAGS